MSITDARAHAKAWSDDGETCVVLKALSGEFLKGFYWERQNPAIPTEQVVEVYENGERIV